MGWQVRGIAAVLLVGLVGSGCSGPAASQPAGSASVGFVCVDDGLRVAGACSRADFEAQQAEQATFAEAKAVYAKFLAERNRLAQEGGADEPTPVMRETAADPYLSDIMDTLRRQKAYGIKAHGDITFQNLHVDRGKTMSGSTFAMSGCEDGSSVTGTMPDGSDAMPGSNTWVSLFLRVDDGVLRIVDADGDVDPKCGR